MSTRVRLHHFLVPLTLLAGLTGCSSSGDHDACKRYLGCVAESDPGKLETLLETYGAEGSCWTSSEIASGCGEFCRTRLRELALSNVRLEVRNNGTAGDAPTFTRTHDSCIECKTDDHCTDEGRPGCHEAGLCVRCTRDEHCQAPAEATPEARSGSSEDDGLAGLLGDVIKGTGSAASGDANSEPAPSSRSIGAPEPVELPRAHCHVARASCVECRVDAHCTDPKYPRCNEALGLCGGCGEDGDCPTDRPACIGAVTDSGTGGFDGSGSAGPYPSDAPYPTDASDAPYPSDPYPSGSAPSVRADGRSYCAQCRDSTQCDGDRPYCQGGACVECLNSGQCSGNASCIEGSCQHDCASVYSCLQSECSGGCPNPNPLCHLTSCKAALDLAQCIATACTGCFTDGFYSYSSDFDCQGCVDISCYDQLERCTPDGC